jgi:DNA topoisomerase-3
MTTTQHSGLADAISKYSVGQKITGKASLREGKTTPPRLFIEADLVDIMDDIGRYASIDKADMAILREKNKAGSGKAGIGTARTRGEIIKKLFESGFLVKSAKSGKKAVTISPTDKGIDLYNKLLSCGVAKTLVSPEMTARWEEGLDKIEKGEIDINQFMSKMIPFVNQMVTDMTSNPTNPMYKKNGSSSSLLGEPVDPHPMHGQKCPKCEKGKLITGKVSKESSKMFGQRYVRCDNKECDYFGEFQP